MAKAAQRVSNIEVVEEEAEESEELEVAGEVDTAVRETSHVESRVASGADDVVRGDPSLLVSEHSSDPRFRATLGLHDRDKFGDFLDLYAIGTQGAVVGAEIGDFPHQLLQV